MLFQAIWESSDQQTFPVPTLYLLHTDFLIVDHNGKGIFGIMLYNSMMICRQQDEQTNKTQLRAKWEGFRVDDVVCLRKTSWQLPKPQRHEIDASSLTLRPRLVVKIRKIEYDMLSYIFIIQC